MAYPCVLLQYFGQTAYIIVHPQDYQSAFWSSIPEPVFWPMLVIGTLAAIVASQVRLHYLVGLANFAPCLPQACPYMSRLKSCFG